MPFIAFGKPTDNTRQQSPGYGYGGAIPAMLGAQGGNESKYSGQVPNGGSMNFARNPFGAPMPGLAPQATPPIYAGGGQPVNPFANRMAGGQPVQARWGGMANPLGPHHVKGSGAGSNFVYGQDRTLPTATGGANADGTVGNTGLPGSYYGNLGGGPNGWDQFNQPGNGATTGGTGNITIDPATGRPKVGRNRYTGGGGGQNQNTGGGGGGAA